MPQEFVTTLEVAAPAEVTLTAADAAAPAEVALEFQDPRRICEKLNDALAFHGFRRAAYSEPTQSLFRLAWAVATHKRSTQVTVYHLAYALICCERDAGQALAEHLKSDAGSFAVGCILKIVTLGVSTGDAEIVPPSVDAVRWLAHSAAQSGNRGNEHELHPQDLVRTVQDSAVPGTVRTHLRIAARLGTRSDLVIGGTRVQAPNSPSEVPKHIAAIEKGRIDASETDDLTSLVELIEDFEQRRSTDADQQKQALARIEALLDKRSGGNPLPRRPTDLVTYSLMPKLETIDARVRAIERAQLRPPSNAQVAAAVVAVLAFGVTAGLALTYLHPASGIAQVFSSLAN